MNPVIFGIRDAFCFNILYFDKEDIIIIENNFTSTSEKF